MQRLVLTVALINRLPLAKLRGEVKVPLYQTPAEVLYAGPAPGFTAGVYQINFRAWAVANATATVTVVASRGAVESHSPSYTTIWVEQKMERPAMY